MTRFPQKLARKGSQKWVQKLVNDKPHVLNAHIWSALDFSKEEDIQWFSPLRSDNYAEYRDETFLSLLDIKLERVPLAQFWPKGGPQWDALGKSSSGKLFLVEAKSYIGELISTLHARDENSILKIRESLQETKSHLGSKTEFDWTKNFYQYTNRLAHLYLLRQNAQNAYLVFVYFLNDWEMKGPSTVLEWQGAIKLLHASLGVGRHQLRNYIVDLFIDINQLQ